MLEVNDVVAQEEQVVFTLMANSIPYIVGWLSRSGILSRLLLPRQSLSYADRTTGSGKSTVMTSMSKVVTSSTSTTSTTSSTHVSTSTTSLSKSSTSSQVPLLTSSSTTLATSTSTSASASAQEAYDNSRHFHQD